MQIAKRFLAGLALAVSGGVHATDYQAGQVWAYHARPGEEASRIVVAKVELVPEFGIVYHVRIDGLKLKNTRFADGIQRTLPHVPVTAKSLDSSVTHLAGKADRLPDVSAGYAEWHRALDAHQAGAFDIPIAEILGAVEEQTSKKQ